MAYKIIDVEGIGPVYAAKLQEAGIQTTEDYLAVRHWQLKPVSALS